MSLADFWNNITTPGFLSASFDELKEMSNEFKDEMIEHFKEGEELFIDGFKEMVIKDNNDYRTSRNKREDSEKEIKAVQQTLLEARGVTEEIRPLLNVICDEFNSLVHAIREYELSEVEPLYNDLRIEFPHIALKTSDELFDFILCKYLFVKFFVSFIRFKSRNFFYINSNSFSYVRTICFHFSLKNFLAGTPI